MRRTPRVLVATVLALILLAALTTVVVHQGTSVLPTDRTRADVDARVNPSTGVAAAPQGTRNDHEGNLPQVGLPRAPETELSIAQVMAKVEVPVHPWHAERVATIRSESVSQMIANLCNFDDNHLAMTTRASRGHRNGEMASEIARVTNLFRVRRLLQEGRADPQSVLAPLSTYYAGALSGWPDALKQRVDVQKAADKEGTNVSRSEPTAYDRAQAIVVAGTYLMGELGDHESLGQLAKSYSLHRKWAEDLDRYCFNPAPAPPAMLLYAMHRVVTRSQIGTLALASQTALRDYLTWAKGNISEGKTRIGSAWYADYDESDVYRRMVDSKGLVLSGQPAMELVVYPSKFADGVAFHADLDDDHKVEGRTLEWERRLFAVVNLLSK